MQHANQIKYVMSEMQYVKMLTDLSFDNHPDYEYDELRAFIRMTRIETKRVIVQVQEYRKNKTKPDYIKDCGIWYTGLNLRINKLKRVRNKAIELRNKLK